MSISLGNSAITQIMEEILAIIPPNQVVPLSQILPNGITIGTFAEMLEDIALTTILSVRQLANTDSAMAYSLSAKLYIPMVREVPEQYRKRGVSQYMLERVTVQEFMRRAAEPIVGEVSAKITADLKLSNDKN